MSVICRLNTFFFFVLFFKICIHAILAEPLIILVLGIVNKKGQYYTLILCESVFFCITKILDDSALLFLEYTP